ncbi:MAG: protein kinase, partial [Planctomycetes bacterium]|nr:protein kinase [Planctomycetota bacterium]
MLSSGSTFGKYEIDSVLGQGGFGVVYKAHEKTSERVVALKLLNEDLAGSEEYREKLANEAKLNALVDSPYVVKVWEYNEIDNRQFIAMEYVPGDDLRGAFDRLEFEEKLDLAANIGEGIAAAHRAGLVHRDLKPENIKIDDSGLPRILDFGLAQDVTSDSVDDQGNIEGSLYYFSPEQLSGDTVTSASDIFSYGTLVYELCVGCRPFEDVYQDAIMYSILHEDPDPPSEINEDLPLWFDELIGRLLAKAPADRFASISEALEFLRQSRETGLTPGKTWERPRQTVTVVDLKNRSGDESWDYFAEGFTDDIVKELSRRTDLIVNAEPATSHQRDIRKT